MSKQAEEIPELVVADAAAWQEWLGKHHGDASGVWLVLSKKGTVTPTSLPYDQALEGALSHGWIDGQALSRDESTYRQRFTPRRSRSRWSMAARRRTRSATCSPSSVTRCSPA